MSSRNCQYSIRRAQKTCRKYMAMSSRRETRAGEEERRKIRPDRLSLSPISGPSDRPRPIDLSRARRRTHGTSRTTRSRHGHGAAAQRLRFPVGDTFGITPPTSNKHRTASHSLTRPNNDKGVRLGPPGHSGGISGMSGSDAGQR